MNPWVDLAISFGRAFLIWMIPLSMIPLMIWFERKVSAYIADRTGPNRAHIAGVRMAGFVHNFADVLKLVMKEDIVPANVHKFYFLLAPFLSMMIALTTMAVVPFADVLRIDEHEIPMQALRLNIGVLWVFAIASFGVLGIIFAGYGANSKYSILGGLRASAQMISYELSLSLSILGLIMVFGTLDLNSIAQQQGALLFGFLPKWGVFLQPVGAILFMTAVLAETNRNPFDLPEAESEIVGYHVEYSSLKFALFFMAEYVNIIVASGVTATLFFGGWQVPWLNTQALIDHAQVVVIALLALLAVMSILLLLATRRWHRTLQRLYADMRRHEAKVWGTLLLVQLVVSLGGIAWFATHSITGNAANVTAAIIQLLTFGAKVTFFGFAFVWVRWTLPRFRYDQLMGLGWKVMLPLALANLFVTALVLLLLK
jgi:NADH-quinone oxidoreductase subunit H